MKTVGVVVFIIGILFLGLSFYIKSQVAEGREQISSAKRSVNTTSKVFSFSSYTQPVGDAISSSANKKIQAGTEEADLYERRALYLMIGGIVCLVLGVGLFIVARKKKG